MSNFRSGYLQQGYPLGNLTLEVSVTTPAPAIQWINVQQYGMALLYSDNVTPAARNISITDGSVVGQNLVLINAGETGSFNLQNAGNTILSANWVPLNQYDNLTLVWTGAIWAETSRAETA